MLHTIECSSGILFDKTENNTIAEIGYAIIEDIELGNCNGIYNFKENVIIKLNTNELNINKDCKYKTDNVFTLKLNECIINESIYCDIEIHGIWLQSDLKNGSSIFETSANAYANIKLIED